MVHHLCSDPIEPRQEKDLSVLRLELQWRASIHQKSPGSDDQAATGQAAMSTLMLTMVQVKECSPKPEWQERYEEVLAVLRARQVAKAEAEEREAKRAQEGDLFVLTLICYWI